MMMFTCGVRRCDSRRIVPALHGPFDRSSIAPRLTASLPGVKMTIDYVQSVPASQIDGTDDKDVTVPRRDGSMTLKGELYLKHFVLPNFFFHVTTTYALLRHNGVDLGKSDYLGALKQ